ncbi:hypothetical protein LMG26696_01645 [Achromobacter pulmonis]|nr:hypothetical protein LMG26696_01645 [Achromobacter pulmonis]
MVLHQPLRYVAAQAAQAAGDQHRAVRIDHAAALRRHQHHLADVARLRDEAQRVRSIVEREGAQRQRLELALGEQRGDRGQHLLDALDAGLGQVVDAVGHPRMVGLDPGRVAQVDLAHLQKASARLEHGEAGVDELARQGVEHNVEAAARRRLGEGLDEVQAARGADVVIGQPQLAQRRPLRFAGGAVDLGAVQPRQLHRRHADAAGRRMHQHALAGLHVAQHVQAVPRRQEGHGNGGGLLEAEVVRLGHHLPRIHHDGRAEGAARQPQHRIARLEVLDGAADFGDHAGELQAQRGNFHHAQGVQHVQEVHAGGLDRGADLARRQRLIHQRLDRQRLVQAALGGDFQAPVAFGRQRQSGVRRRLLQAWRQDLAAAQRAFGLVSQRQRRCQRVQVGRGLAQIDDAQGQFRMLVARGAQQAPQRTGAQVGHRIVAAGADGAARHPDDRLGEAGQRQFLHLQQRAGGLAVRRLDHLGVAGPQLDHAIAGLGLVQLGDVDHLRASLHQTRAHLVGPRRAAAAQQAPGAAEHGFGRFDRLPLRAEQEAVDAGLRQAPQRGAVDAARVQALQSAHMLAVGVIQVERSPELALAHLELRHLDPDFGQAVLPDRQAFGLERHEHVVAHLRLQALRQQQRMHRRIQQRRMQAVADRRGGGRLRQRHPRPDIAVHVPGGVDALERRPIAVAEFMQVLVERGHVDRIAVRRRQLDGLLARDLRRHQLAFGMQLPFAFLVRFRRTVDVHGAGPARFRAHGDLHAHRRPRCQHHRRQDDHVGQVPRALDLAACGAHGFEKGGARHQHRVHHLVLLHPGRLVGRHHRGEHRHVGAGDLHAAAQQLVVGVVQAGADGARGHRFEPVALALEGIGGQLDQLAAIRREEAAPVHRRAQHVQLGQALLQGLGLVLGRVERRHPGDRTVIGQAGRAHARQHRLRPQFQEGVDALLVQSAHAGVETHRLARLLHPVLGLGHFAAPGQLAGQAADQRQPGRGVIERLRHLAEGAQHRFQQMRVEGVRHLQPLGLALLLLEVRHHLVDAVEVARHHRLLRRIQAGQRDLRGQAERGQGSLDLGGAGLQRCHATAGRQRLHQAAARGHQAAGVVQVEHARRVGSGDFADAVAQQQFRLHAPVLPHAPQCHLQREQRRLGEVGAVEQGRLGRAGLGEHHIQQRLFQLGKALRNVVQRLAEHRVGLVQPLAHAGQLAALAGKQQRQAALALALIDHADRARRHFAGAGIRGQRIQQVRLALGEHHQALAEMRAGGGQRIGHIQEAVLDVHAHVQVQLVGLRAQRRQGEGRQHEGQRFRRRHRLGGAGRRDRLGRFFDNNVGIGAANPEGADAGAARPLARRPWLLLLHQRHLRGIPVHRRGRLDHVQGDGQFLVVHRQHRFHHAGQAGRRLGVAQVGLDRADPQRPLGRVAAAEHRRQAIALDRIAQLGAGAVRLQVVDVRRLQARHGQRLADHALLRRAAGRGQAGAVAGVVDGGAAQDRQNRIAVALRVRQALEHHHRRALAPAGAVGAGRERLAAPVRRHAAQAAEFHVQVGRQHQRHARGHRQVALALAQRIAGQVRGHQRRRAGGVDRHARPFQAQHIRNPARHGAAGRAGADVAVQVGQAASQRQAILVVALADADEDAGLAAAQLVHRIAGVLDRLRRDFQHHALGRIERPRLARRNAEERRVEQVDGRDEAAAHAVRLAARVRVGVIDGGRVPAFLGHFDDTVAAAFEQAPQVFGRVDIARQAAGHRHNGDGLIGQRIAALGRIERRLLVARQVRGQILDGEVLVQGRGRYIAAQQLLQFGLHPHHPQRIAADLEKAVVDADAVVSQHLGPDRLQLLFQFVGGLHRRLQHHLGGLGQRLAVDLAVRRQRELVQLDEEVRDHVARQARLQPGPQHALQRRPRRRPGCRLVGPLRQGLARGGLRRLPGQVGLFAGRPEHRVEGPDIARPAGQHGHAIAGRLGGLRQVAWIDPLARPGRGLGVEYVADPLLHVGQPAVGNVGDGQRLAALGQALRQRRQVEPVAVPVERTRGLRLGAAGGGRAKMQDDVEAETRHLVDVGAIAQQDLDARNPRIYRRQAGEELRRQHQFALRAQAALRAPAQFVRRQAAQALEIGDVGVERLQQRQVAHVANENAAVGHGLGGPVQHGQQIVRAGEILRHRVDDHRIVAARRHFRQVMGQAVFARGLRQAAKVAVDLVDRLAGGVDGPVLTDLGRHAEQHQAGARADLEDTLRAGGQDALDRALLPVAHLVRRERQAIVAVVPAGGVEGGIGPARLVGAVPDVTPLGHGGGFGAPVLGCAGRRGIAQAIGHQLIVAAHHHGAADILVAGHGGLDLAQFDAEAAQLDLAVIAAQHHQLARLLEARQVAGAVQRARPERVGTELRRGLRRVLVVAARHAGATDAQLASEAGRHRRQVGIQHVQLRIGDGPADDDVLARLHLPDARPDRGLGRAVHVPHRLGARQQLVGQGTRQGLAAAQQALERDGARPARLQQQLPGGGRGLHHGHGMAAHQVQQRLAVQAFLLPRNHHAGAADQRQEQFQRRDIEGDGGDREQAVAGLAARLGPHRQQEVAERAVRDLHPLGLAGGTGRENHIGQVIGPRRARRIGAVVVGLGQGRAQVQATLGPGAQAAIARRRRRDQQRRLGRLQHLADTVRRKCHVDRHIGRARLQHRQQRHHHIDGSVQAHAHQLPAPDAFATQHAGQPVGAGVQFAI